MTLIKIKTFLKSLFFHVWSGFPKSTQEEINFRFKICTQECDMYNIDDSTCMMCGCNVNKKKNIYEQISLGRSRVSCKKMGKN
jgi:hypothetical protein